jgi:sigma-B regulation protein RsbU (phosphoserine phosphatase)
VSREASFPPELYEGVKLFSGVPYEQVAPLLAACAMRDLQPKEVLLRPGQNNHDLFLLLSGRLQVSLESADAPFGFPIQAGEFAGEMSVIDGQLTSAFVVADQSSTVLVVSETCLWQQLAPIPGVMHNLLRLVAQRIRLGNEAMFSAQKQKLRFEEMERELANAREIQLAMLPQSRPLLAAVDHVDVHALMEEAREVGGDFYDAFELDEMHVCIVVGDVSGKGMPAALFMARALTLLRAEARNGGDITTIIGRLNDSLAADNASCTFVTLCVAVVNVESGETLILSGGHDAPIAKLGGACWEFLPKPAGPLVGVMPGAQFATHRLRLAPSDTLILFTDGVTEAENRDSLQYSAARLRDTLNQHDLRSAESTVLHVRHSVAEHAAGFPPSDDITIFALRFLG